MKAQIAGVEVTTPPASERDLAEMRTSSTRMTRGVEGHQDALRKLGNAVRVAAHHGATWDEIFETVVAAAADAVEDGRPGARLSATARASIHDGDDRF